MRFGKFRAEALPAVEARESIFEFSILIPISSLGRENLIGYHHPEGLGASQIEKAF